MTLELSGQTAPVVEQTEQPAASQPNEAPATGEATENKAPEKTFTQAELDEILSKRLAKAEAKAERRVLRTLERVIPQAPPSAPVQQQDDGRPRRAHYADEEQFVDALTDWKLEQRERVAQSQKAREQAENMGKKTADMYAKAEKIDGFDREVFDENLTAPIAQALVDSDSSERLMHYLSTNPEDMERIAGLSATRQIIELGKIEAKLAAKPPAQSKAPRPLEQLRGGAAPTGAPDPRNVAAWIEYQNGQDLARKRGLKS